MNTTGYEIYVSVAITSFADEDDSGVYFGSGFDGKLRRNPAASWEVLQDPHAVTAGVTKPPTRFQIPGRGSSWSRPQGDKSFTHIQLACSREALKRDSELYDDNFITVAPRN